MTPTIPVGFGDDYTYEYDLFGRLRKVKNRTSPYALVAEYTYNGLGQRIGWHCDVDDGSGNGPDGTVDAYDPWYRFVYDDAWRVIALYRGSDANPKEQFVYHAAGLGGMGVPSAARETGRHLTGQETGPTSRGVFAHFFWFSRTNHLAGRAGSVITCRSSGGGPGLRGLAAGCRHPSPWGKGGAAAIGVPSGAGGATP